MSDAWLSISRSCISQNRPCAAAASAASAASSACSCTSTSGRWRNTNAQVVAERAHQLADDRLGLAAVGAFEVAVLDERDRARRAGRGRGRRSGSTSSERSRMGGASPSAPLVRPGAGAGCWMTVNTSQPSSDATIEAAEDPQLGLLELDALERDVGDEQRHREPDAGDRGRADERWPRDGAGEPAEPRPRHQPGHADDAERLAHDEPDDDAEDDRLGQDARARPRPRGSRRRWPGRRAARPRSWSTGGTGAAGARSATPTAPGDRLAVRAYSASAPRGRGATGRRPVSATRATAGRRWPAGRPRPRRSWRGRPRPAWRSTCARPTRK